MANSEQTTAEALTELRRRSRRTLAIVVVGMLIIVVSLLATAFHLQSLRRSAEDELARYKALRQAVSVAQTADPGAREAILAGATQLADQTASARPAQTPLEQLEVRIWICTGSPGENRTQAETLRTMRPASATQRWRRDYLSVETNAQPIYRLDRNEIRYNPAEEDAADRLQQMIRSSFGVEVTKVLTFFPTPGSISVFFCAGTNLPPLPTEVNPPPPPPPPD